MKTGIVTLLSFVLLFPHGKIAARGFPAPHPIKLTKAEGHMDHLSVDVKGQLKVPKSTYTRQDKEQEPQQ